MKRDLEICRDILIYIQDNGRPYETLELKIDKYPDDEIAYNLGLLADEKYVELVTGYPPDKLVYGKISWNGHEFLSAVLDNKFWEKAKKNIKGKIGSASFSVVLFLLNEYAKKQIIN